MGIRITQPSKEKSAFENAQRGILFEENGLWGMKNEDGSILYPPEYLFIGKCVDNILFIKHDWHYVKLWQGCKENGFLSEEERPYIVNGKAGFMIDGKIVIPAEYDYLTISMGSENGRVFFAVKDGRSMYLDEIGKEVLTRVRHFPDEAQTNSPFWLVTNDFEYFTTMSYVGEPRDNNPNVVKIDGAWVELERYNKDEILQMLINPADDLALTEENLKLMCNKFSYEYSVYFANVKGKNPLAKCRKQLQKMNVFCNSWYYVVKIWLANGEQLDAKELRKFFRFLSNTEEGTLGTPLFAIGHCDSLQPGEVRMLMITHYHERCFPPFFEYEWSNKRKNYPVCQLKEELPWLRKEIDEKVQEEYREEVFQDQLLYCISDLKYYKEQSWEQAKEAIEIFFELGSPITHSLINFLENAKWYRFGKNKNDQATIFFLKAALWALENGGDVNEIQNRNSPLDIIDAIMKTDLGDEEHSLAKKLREQLLQKGAKTYREQKDEWDANTDYFKELEYLHIDGTSEKVMPSLNYFTTKKMKK